MVRRFAAGMFALLLFSGVLLAEVYTGKLDKVTPDKGTGVIRDDKDLPHPFKVGDTTKFVEKDGKEIKDGIKGLKVGDELSVTVEGKGKKAMTKEVKRNKAAP
jgi:hypothetical protein